MSSPRKLARIKHCNATFQKKNKQGREGLEQPVVTAPSMKKKINLHDPNFTHRFDNIMG